MTARRRRAVDSDRAARRAELLDAADRVIREAGPDASMTAIAAEAGITKPILYRHFGDKSGLYRALAERYIQPLLGAIRRTMGDTEDPGERVHETIDTYLAFIETNRQVYRFLMQRAQVEDPEAGSAVSATIRRLGEEVGTALRATRGLQGAGAVAADALGHGIVGMVHVAGDWWLEDPQLARGELTAYLSALVLRGVEGFGGLPWNVPDGVADATARPGPPFAG